MSKRRKVWGICLSLAFLVCAGCQPRVAAPPAAVIPPAGYTNITPAELKSMLEGRSKEFVLLDVRQPEEYMEGHIEWSVLMPKGEIYERYTELDKEKEIVVYCRSGRRSAAASDVLVNLGFRKVRNLEGGILAWPYPIIK